MLFLCNYTEPGQRVHDIFAMSLGRMGQVRLIEIIMDCRGVTPGTARPQRGTGIGSAAFFVGK